MLKNHLALIFFIFSLNALAQDQVDVIREYFDEVRKGNSSSPANSIFTTSKEHLQVIQALKPFLNDSLDNIRFKALNIGKRIGDASSNEEVIKQAINLHITALKDKDSGMLGQALKGLRGYKLAAYDNAQKQQILNQFKYSMPYWTDFTKLIGYLNPEGGRAKLITLNQQNMSPKENWQVNLALARMGDESAVNYVFDKASSTEVNDPFVYGLLNDLVYTRQKKIFEILTKEILNEDANCNTADPDSNRKIPCAYYVMEFVAPAISNYPIKVDKYGDAMINNYEKSLLEVREWLNTNPDISLTYNTY